MKPDTSSNTTTPEQSKSKPMGVVAADKDSSEENTQNVSKKVEDNNDDTAKKFFNRAVNNEGTNKMLFFMISLFCPSVGVTAFIISICKSCQSGDPGVRPDEPGLPGDSSVVPMKDNNSVVVPIDEPSNEECKNALIQTFEDAKKALPGNSGSVGKIDKCIAALNNSNVDDVVKAFEEVANDQAVVDKFTRLAEERAKAMENQSPKVSKTIKDMTGLLKRPASLTTGNNQNSVPGGQPYRIDKAQANKIMKDIGMTK